MILVLADHLRFMRRHNINITSVQGLVLPSASVACGVIVVTTSFEDEPRMQTTLQQFNDRAEAMATMEEVAARQIRLLKEAVLLPAPPPVAAHVVMPLSQAVLDMFGSDAVQVCCIV